VSIVARTTLPANGGNSLFHVLLEFFLRPLLGNAGTHLIEQLAELRLPL
jgi:hypothetical protein